MFRVLPGLHTFSMPKFCQVMLTLRSAHTMGLDQSQGLVASCELATFATKSSHRDQNLVPATSPTNSNWFELWGHFSPSD